MFVCQRKLSRAILAVVGLRKVCLLSCAFLLGLYCQCQDLGADYPSKTAVEQAFLKRKTDLKKAESCWKKFAVARGSKKTSEKGFVIDWYDAMTDRYLFSDWFVTKTIKNLVGTIVAVPCREFEVGKAFSYVDVNGRGEKEVRQGKWVAVKVRIGYPNSNKPPSESACAKAVKDLAEVGMAIPKSEGLAGKIIAVKESTKKRFGASVARVSLHDSENGKIWILCFNCQKDQEREKYLPGTYEGK